MKSLRHGLLMAAGCVVMLVGLFLLPALGVRLGGALPLVFALACPLSMVFMMGSMGRMHRHDGEGDEETSAPHAAHRHDGAGVELPKELPAPVRRQ